MILARASHPPLHGLMPWSSPDAIRQRGAMFAGEFHVARRGRWPIPAAANLSGGVSTAGGGRRPAGGRPRNRSTAASGSTRPRAGMPNSMPPASSSDAEQSRLADALCRGRISPRRARSAGTARHSPKPCAPMRTITTDVVLVGLYDRIEVWSPVSWLAYLSGLKSGTKWRSGRFSICCNTTSMPIGSGPSRAHPRTDASTRWRHP